MSGFLLHLLRHGPPLRSGLLLGHCDEPALHPAAPALLARASGLDIGGVVASDLRRAADSARMIAGAMDLPLTLDPRWRELDFGLWNGLAPGDVPPADLARFWNDPDRDPPPGGERWQAIRHRVGAALRDVAGAALVVTHAGAMRAALAVLTGLDHRGVWTLDLPYGALLSLRVWPGEHPSGQIVGLRTDALA
jgi:alpha-ribazole phosphatase